MSVTETHTSTLTHEMQHLQGGILHNLSPPPGLFLLVALYNESEEHVCTRHREYM